MNQLWPLALVFVLAGADACTKQGGQGGQDAPPDPTPKAGAKLQTATTLDKMREALRVLTEKDQVHFAVGSVGRGDDSITLSVQIKSDAPCEIVAVEGVAYGFDADGKAARMNKGGEKYVAFAKEGLKVASKGKEKLEFPLKHPDTASVAVGHIDRYQCADGTTWSRP